MKSQLLPAFRWLAIACLLAIAVLSLVPGDDRPHTGYSGNIEHLVAYVGTAFFTSAFLPALRGWRSVLGLSLASALFEVLQLFIPGRGPGVDNWLASTSGAVIGVGCAAFAARLLPALFTAGRRDD